MQMFKPLQTNLKFLVHRPHPMFAPALTLISVFTRKVSFSKQRKNAYNVSECTEVLLSYCLIIKICRGKVFDFLVWSGLTIELYIMWFQPPAGLDGESGSEGSTAEMVLTL